MASLVSILDNAQPAGEATKHLKMLIYGEGGTGKTVFGATGPNPFILAIERNGAKSLLNHSELARTPVLKITTYAQFVEAYKEFRGGTDPYETIVIDSLTALASLWFDEFLRNAAAKNPDTRDINTPQLQDYQPLSQALRRALQAYCDLDKHVIILAQEEYDTIEKELKGGQRYYAPAVTPKLQKTVFEMVDIVARLANVNDLPSETFRVEMQTVPSRTVKARSRVTVPAVIENPTFSDFLKGL